MVRQTYWRLVHKGAWERSKKNFQWLYPLAFGALVFALNILVSGFDKARDGLVPRLIVGGATVIFAVGGYCYNVFRSAAEIHADQSSAISRIEKMKDTEIAVATAKHSAERAELKGEIQSLQHQLSGKQKDQALADKLTKLRRYGISDLLNRQPPSFPTEQKHITEWQNREKLWMEEIMNAMREHGCSDQDLHRVEMIGTFALLPLHNEPTVAKDLSMLSVRLERIQAIIDKYAQ